MKINRLAATANSSGVSCLRANTSARVAEVSSPLSKHHAAWRTAAAAIGFQLMGLLTPATATTSAAALEVAWNANPEPDVVSYEVSYGTASGSHPTTIDAGAETRASISGLQVGTTYYLVVRAVSGTGLKSAASAELAYTVPASPGTVVPPDPDPVNQAPVAAATSVATQEDAAVSFAISASDANGNPLTYQIVAGPTKGTLSGTAPNLTYTPSANVHGSDSFTFKANDGAADSNTATVSITVNPVNDAPVAAAQSVATPEDTPVSIAISAADVEGATLGYQIVTGPTKGTLSGTAPNLTYTPSANVHGSDSFTFKANDGAADSNTATVSITVSPVNDAPVAAAKSVATNEDSPVTFTVSASDIDGNPLTYQIVAGPANGSLSGSAPNLTYTPAANFNGSDSFTFKANDGTLNSNTATVSIAVNPMDEEVPGTLVSRTAWTVQHVDSQETDGYSAILAFDGDPDTYWHTAWSTGVTQAPHVIRIDLGSTRPIKGFRYLPRQDAYAVGSIKQYEFITSLDGINWTQAASGTFVFTIAEKEVLFTERNARFIGLRAFTDYSGTHHAAVAELNAIQGSGIGIPANQAPVAAAKSVATPEDTPVSFTTSASDAEGNPLVYQIVAGPARGTLTGTIPNLTYRPAANFSGSDSFTFKANDGNVDSNIATVTIAVGPVNDAPVAAARSASTSEDTPVTITVSATDTDGNPLSYQIVGVPSNGTLAGTAPNLIYTPFADFHGNDSFSFKANDGSADSNTATVAIAVSPANDAPVVTAMAVGTGQNSPVAVDLPAFDKDGDPLTYQLVSMPVAGTLSGSAPNLVYTPSAGFHGDDSFSFKVNDGVADSNTAMVSISVTATAESPVNRPPYFASNPFKAAEGSQGKPLAGITIASSAVDPDSGDSIVFSKEAGPAWLSVSPNGDLSGTPPRKSKGIQQFAIRATDSSGASAEATLLIDIKGAELPLPWEVDLIGSAGAEVDATYGNAAFNLESKGDLTGNSDSGTFAWQTLTGDGQIIARVQTLRGAGDSTRAGIMIRDSLAAKSRHIFIGVDGKGDFRSVQRNRSGSASVVKAHGSGKTPGIWVKLVRNGDTITSFTSVNGKKWNRVGATTVDYGRTCYIGLLTSGGKGGSASTEFRNVKVAP